MATLDDKLLGEKLHYYCSSSEDEGGASDDEGEEGKGARGGGVGGGSGQAVSQAPGQEWDGSSANTGPKGVLKDWQRYKQLETEMREEAEIEKLALAKKLALTCRSTNDDDKQKQKDDAIDQEIEELLDDGFLESFIKQRMQEMIDKTQNTTKIFGKLIDLVDGQSFLDHIDKEDPKVIVIILVYENSVQGCEAMSGCLQCLAADYTNVKFCRILSSVAGLSKHFESSGVPALIIYRAGQQLSNFIRVTDQLGEDFYATDVESFLLEHGMLPSKEDVPAIIRGPAINKDNDDDDD